MDLFGICPHVTAQRLFAGKWTILIMHNLSERTYRFGELHREIPGITQSTLTNQLRFLEAHNLVFRHIYKEIPPKVEYSLTDIGRAIFPVMDQLKIFGDKYIEYLNGASKE